MNNKVDYMVYDEQLGNSWQVDTLEEAEKSLKTSVDEGLDDYITDDSHAYSGVYQKIRSVAIVEDDRQENYPCTDSVYRSVGYDLCTESCDYFNKCSDENPDLEPWPHDDEHESVGHSELRIVNRDVQLTDLKIRDLTKQKDGLNSALDEACKILEEVAPSTMTASQWRENLLK